VIGALLLGGTNLPFNNAHAVAITQTLSTSPTDSVTVNTGGGALIGFINFTDTETDSNVSRGRFLGFDGFDSNLGTLDLVTWDFSGFNRVVGRASSTCVNFLGVFCSTESTTTTDYTLFADILDGVPVDFDFLSAINNFRVTIAGSGIIGCITFADCTNVQSTTRNIDTTVVRSGGALSAYVDVPAIQVEVGGILSVRNRVDCSLAIAVLTECFGEGQGSASPRLSVMLTYDFTPASMAVPLPASVWLLVVGLGGLGATSLRGRKRFCAAAGSRIT
jgi:hypothetical protein